MLLDLFIRDFAIIDSLRIQFEAGFNVLTGETGAGKSIILDATTLVLGDRADTGMIRAGCEQSYVEATFRLTGQLQESINNTLEIEGLEGDEDDQLILSRELRLNGRNICRINGRAVSLSLLREIGQRLVDIHGQGDHLTLLRPKSHLPLLDGYAGLTEERNALAKEVEKLRKIRRELEQLRQNQHLMAQRIDLLQFQIREIDAAQLRLGEEEELRAERTRLANTEHIIQYSNETLAYLNGQEDELPGAGDLLSQAERSLTSLSKNDPNTLDILERFQGLVYQLSDVVAELMDYQERVEHDPARLEFVEERLEMIGRLKRKYGADIEDILKSREKAGAELNTLTHSEERLDELEVLEDTALHTIGRKALLLSNERQTAARQLARDVENELSDLQMEDAKFEIEIRESPDSDGAYVHDRRLSFDETGIDEVEFLVTANPGEPLKPLAKVASGGETSRLMLAMKTALAKVDATPTLIFDEIDQGIGGRVGDIVGRKLWNLSFQSSHQVIVVTHLPQLAGYGDRHFSVRKQTVDERTTTTVSTLDRQGRVDELAAMLGTQGIHATGGAESILERVVSVKSTA